MKEKYTRESTVALLLQKRQELTAAGLSRYPQRSDFPCEQVVAIKAFLGPWPRALEAAGIKPPREGDRLAKNRERRARARLRRSEPHASHEGEGETSK